MPGSTDAKVAREGSKKAKVLVLLGRKEGATLAQLMKATGWQAHSIRGFLSGALGKKMGLKIESQKRENGEARHRIAVEILRPGIVKTVEIKLEKGWHGPDADGGKDSGVSLGDVTGCAGSLGHREGKLNSKIWFFLAGSV